MAKARTAKQKAALRKAQLASARKRRGKGRGRSVARKRGGSKLKTAAKVVGVATAIGAAAYTSHKLNGKRKRHTANKKRHADNVAYEKQRARSAIRAARNHTGADPGGHHAHGRALAREILRDHTRRKKHK